MIVSMSIFLTTARRAIFQYGERGAVFRDTLICSDISVAAYSLDCILFNLQPTESLQINDTGFERRRNFCT